ncbi:MAG: bifunctional phosphoribosylaminoimidazolecarboxamide formyltransferase/IMP cyclohydrolase PurH [Planctomycetota bacterium]|nr:MAG: bifunctional phosphoribosylaminoimidazolecarboxamide formyltransferase/IMP cyclohydrolase PurH [Planctomycetota bacterium]
MSIVPIRRALLSVADKSGLEDLAAALAERGVELVSTGGTARVLRAAGLDVREVSEVTEHPEILGGRVKSLHPKIHGGLLARLPQDAPDLERCGIEPFELVVVNLYRFEEAVAAGRPLDELVEEIDIGGPAMLRASAKNFARVALLSDPSHYASFLEEFRAHGGVSLATRRSLALAGFARTAAYDQSIAAALAARFAEDAPSADLPARLVVSAVRAGAPLRYGENPHQRGALYAFAPAAGLGALRRREGGKELSYNNLLDLDAALALSADLPRPGVCVVKHAGPCGAARGETATEALEAAWAGDPLSAFGSVLGVNVEVDLALAEALCAKGFIEAIVAPSFRDEAVACLRARKGWGKSVRLVEASLPAEPGLRLRSVAGGLLVQDADRAEAARWEVVTRRAPIPEEEEALRFAWTCVRHVRSNAIVIAGPAALYGVGGGQPSRVDAVGIAARKAGARARGAALASDAFFPFADGVEAAAEAGVRAIVQPGGSRRDAEVIERADALDLAMVFTGTRHFRH